MKYVYIIMTGGDGDQHPYAIYSSEKKAKARLAEMMEHRYWKTTEPCIEKWEVN